MTVCKPDDQISLALEWTTERGRVLYIEAEAVIELSMLRGMAKFVKGAHATVIPRARQREVHPFTSSVWRELDVMCEAFAVHLQDTTGSRVPLDAKQAENFWLKVPYSVVKNLAEKGNLT